MLPKCYPALLWTGPMSYLANYKLFCLVSALYDYFMTLLLSFFFKTDIKFLMESMFVVVIRFCCRS